jgi:hypothetical protein
MPKKWLIRSLTPALGVAVVALVAPSGAFASAEHPKLIVNGEEKSTRAAKTVSIDWGQIQLKNRFLGSLECVNLVFGTNFNETEPGKAGGGTESVKAYGEVLGWTGASFTNASGLEPAPHCKSSTGFVAWATPEPAPALNTVAAKETATGTEHLFIRGAFGGGNGTKRIPPSLPWRGEGEGTENAEHVKTFWLKTGIPTSPTERATVEAEEAAAGVPPAHRSGCYHEPPFTEITRQPGYVSEKETELAVKPAPQGCIKVNIVAPEAGLVTPFQGTLEPEAVNGSRNSITPSSGSFKGGFIGTEPGVENSSEHNERALLGSFGPGYTRSITPIKEIGYLNSALITTK